MPEFTLQTKKLNDIMRLLYHLLNIRVTFYDLRNVELDALNSPVMSEFCRRSRLDPRFDARCHACDGEHLRLAKQTKKMQIYHCHAGLLEGIVPLYTCRGEYIGAIVFGQLADRESPSPPHGERTTTVEEMTHMGNLLKHLGEYIGENELIRADGRSWVEQTEEYIQRHLTETITLKALAAEIGKSTSFLSHNFPVQFNMPLKDYIRARRMEIAMDRLSNGKIVRECAFELGYSDEFYFSKEFKRFYGYPPGVVRKNHRSG